MTSLTYSFTKPDLSQIDKRFLAVELPWKSLDRAARALHGKEIDVNSVVDAEIADEIGKRAKALYVKGVPAPINGFVVNRSRPTSDPDIWKGTPGMNFWLHPITAFAGDVKKLGVASVGKKGGQELWCAASLMAYQL